MSRRHYKRHNGAWKHDPQRDALVTIYDRGVATVGISVFIPPKSAQVNFLWGKNDGRTAIQQYTPKTFIYTPKQISGYAPGCLSLLRFSLEKIQE